MIEIIADVQLKKVGPSVIEGYQVCLVLDGLKLSMVGRSDCKDNLNDKGSFSFDIVASKKDYTLAEQVEALVVEAQVLVNSIIALGYDTVTDGVFSVISIIKALNSRAQLIITRELAQAFMTADVSVSTNAFLVEAISVVDGAVLVAKVLADLTYDVLGFAQNPKGIAVRACDVVRVVSNGGVLTLDS